ncbi:hypothetical protein CVT26_003359 [Gymnopilus dilepis]|uniref:N-acetyltransferase domain-containing protein n=1 Tax=Gymnopilus dilepis TaxID=231916 RepID=A0A409VQJ0_9AGAR|nr:hypothetical protein CVT26_003359 [Gymnopilus dilepis]
MSSSIHTVFVVPTPASPEHTSAYRNIRLKGLRLNPEAFGSTYARESAFLPEAWPARLNHPGRTTLGAAKAGDEVGGEWIGTCSIIAPEMMRPENREEYPRRLKEAEDRGEAEVYMLVGMWVDVDFRQLGVGRALIRRALETVRSGTSSDGKTNNEAEFKKKIVLLEVHRANTNARKLYEKAGFSIEEEIGLHEDGKEMWMAIEELHMNEAEGTEEQRCGTVAVVEKENISNSASPTHRPSSDVISPLATIMSHDEKHPPVDVSDDELDSSVDGEKAKLLSSRESSPAPAHGASLTNTPEDPRFARTPPSPFKRLALVIFLAFLFWLGFQMRSSLLESKRHPKVIHASRYSKEYKFRPAASPVITETLRDGRVRVRGALPSPTEPPKLPKKKAGTGKVTGKKRNRKSKPKKSASADKRM